MGIFVAPPKRNVVAEILVPSFKAIAEGHLQKLSEEREQNSLQMLQQQLGDEDVSPLKFATLLAQTKDIKPETKQMLLEANKLNSQIVSAQNKAANKSTSENKKIEATKAYGRTIGLTDEEMDKAQVKTNEDVRALKKELHPKEKPVGGLGALPVPEDISEAMDKIVADNPDASPDELVRLFNKAKIPPSHQKPYLENRRQGLIEKEKVHEGSAKYDESLLKSAKLAKEQVEVAEEMLQHVDKVSPTQASSLLKGMGNIGRKIANAFETKDQAAIKSLTPRLLEGWKDIFGVRLSDADLKVLEDKLPSIDKSPEANREVLELIKKYARKASIRYEIGQKIKEKNKGFRPRNYADLVEKEYDNLTGTVEMIGPDGNRQSVKKTQVKSALNQGYKLAQ